MRRITEDVTDLVLEYGGSLSGEHGDGLARSEWNEKMFGPRRLRGVLPASRRRSIRNSCSTPARSSHAPPMTDNLRYGPATDPAEPPTVFDYSKQEGFVRSIEMCNGIGVCRKTQGGTMCPSFRATRDENDSTRGRANALRLALASPDARTVPAALRSHWVHDVFDLCLMCKACKAECPSNVDVAKLKAEFLHFYYHDRPRPLGHLLAATSSTSIAWARRWRRWSTGCRRVGRRGGCWNSSPASTAAAACRRCIAITSAAGSPGTRRTRRRTARQGAAARRLLHDLQRAGTSARRQCVSWSAPATPSSWRRCTCCGRSLISKGFLHEARSLVQRASSATGTPRR